MNRVRMYIPVALLLLTACASAPKAPPASLEIGGAFTVDVPRGWTHIPDSADGPRTRGDVLTRDGIALNAIRLVGGLRSGDYIARPDGREVRPPVFRSGMDEASLMAFIASSLEVLGYESVSVSAVQPGAFGRADGMQVQIQAKTARGLNMRGSASLAQMRGRLNLVLYMAPEAHYFSASQTDVAALVSSIRLQRGP